MLSRRTSSAHRALPSTYCLMIRQLFCPAHRVYLLPVPSRRILRSGFFVGRTFPPTRVRRPIQSPPVEEGGLLEWTIKTRVLAWFSVLNETGEPSLNRQLAPAPDR